MNASHRVCTELVPTYSNFKELKKKTFTGYKLVEEKGGNFYSIVSGLFRYRPKMVSENSYHSLYQSGGNTKTFNEDLINKVAIFKSKEEAYSSLKHYDDYEEYYNEKLALLEIKIKGNLLIGEYHNCFCENAIVVAGEIIDTVKKIPLI